MVGVLKVQTSPGVWVPVSAGPSDAVHVGPAAPPDPATELWYDTDETGAEVYTKSETDTAIYDHSPGYYAAVGVGYTGSAATETVIATLTVPAQLNPGIAMLWGMLRFDKVATTDTHYVRLRLNNVSGTVISELAYTNLQIVAATLSSAWGTAAATDLTIVMTLVRNAGSGNVTTYAQSDKNNLRALWIAA